MINRIPVVDLSLWNSHEEHQNTFLEQLRFAVHDVGFFYLIGHGLSSDYLAEIQSIARAFFSLPEKAKEDVAMINSPQFRGYNKAASELTRGKPDWREQFDIGAERTPVTLAENRPLWECLHGPNQWPPQLPALKDLMLDFQNRMTAVALRLLRAIAMVLELPEESFDAIYGDKPNEHIKIIRYPGREFTESNQGVGAHKDSGLLTFILQDENKGLQIEVEPNKWINCSPKKDSFVVNLGEILELATNGYLRATVHQVVTPPAGTDRLSIAYFLGASLYSRVPVYPLPRHLAEKSKGVESDPDNPLLRDIGLNYLKGRFRSHPDVAHKYYAAFLNKE